MTRLGKVFLDDRAIDYGQIHADDADLLFAFKPKKIRLQGGFRAAERDVVDAMVLQIAEGGGVALLAREEVLVDAQDLGANRRMILTGSTLQAPEKVALHGRGADALAPSQAAPVDAIQVLLIDHLLEALTGSLATAARPATAGEMSGRNPGSGSCAPADPECRGGNPSRHGGRVRRHQPLFRRREPPHLGHDIGPVYRADIVIVPPLRSMLLISYWGRPKTISESVKTYSPKNVLPPWRFKACPRF